MSADLLKKNSRIRLCCNAFRVWSGWRESNPHCQLGNCLNSWGLCLVLCEFHGPERPGVSLGCLP